MIYLDNAATTETDPEVIKAMLPYLGEIFGNPSAMYQAGVRSRNAIEKSREQAAVLAGCRPGEIYFTSGGSEADNWAIKAVYEALRKRGRHIITTKIEHPAVLRTCEYLEREEGADVTYLDVDREGFVDPAEVEKTIREDTILVSVMAANNEIGTIEPIREIGAAAHAHGVLFHTDAVQTFGQVPLDVDDDNIDLMSVSGHKFNGPKGSGFLYIREGTPIHSFIHGGAQERNRRAGTENVPAIVGLGKAAELAAERLAAKVNHELVLQGHMAERIRNEISCVKLNGPGVWTESSQKSSVHTAGTWKPEDGRESLRRLPNNINFSFEFTEAESALIMLDMKGICASAGSACSTGAVDPSHVLKAAGLSDSLARSALRMTISGSTTINEIDSTVDILKTVIERLRRMSPMYEDYKEGRVGSETA